MRKRSTFLIVIFFIIIIIISLISVINNKISPIIMKYGIGEMKRVSTTIINRSVIDSTFDDINMDELFIMGRNSNEEIVTITLDSRIVNNITNRISDTCEDNLRKVEEGKFREIKKDFNIGEEYFYIPMGVIFGNSLLSNIGPKIPINFKIMGSVNSEIVTNVQEYGINNSLINISLEIKVELLIILPFNSEIVSVSNTVPIAIKLIQGKVPHIYGGNLIN